MKISERDTRWMERAITLARRGKGRTAPNPAVGAVIVRKGKVIGEGWHKKAGADHAEIEALRSLTGYARGATLYVTLEPCNHHGKTPPCAEAIIKSGVARVIIGARDMSPKKGRRGSEALRRAGINVHTGVLGDQCNRIVDDFMKHSTTGEPLVTLKAAITIDGKISTRAGDSKWISCDTSRRMVHRMRNETDAVMVGADTVIYDDPLLTVRQGKSRRDPLRVVVDGLLRIPLRSKIISTSREIPTLVATTSVAPPGKIRSIEKAGAEVMVVPARRGHVNLSKLITRLGERNVMSVMMESGGALGGAALKTGIVDRVMFFIAPKIVGGDQCSFNGAGVKKIADAWRLDGMTASSIGTDILVEGKISGGG